VRRSCVAAAAGRLCYGGARRGGVALGSGGDCEARWGEGVRGGATYRAAANLGVRARFGRPANSSARIAGERCGRRETGPTGGPGLQRGERRRAGGRWRVGPCCSGRGDAVLRAGWLAPPGGASVAVGACGPSTPRGRSGAEARGKRLRPSWAGVRRAAGSWVLGFRGKRAGEEDWTGLRWVWAGGLGFLDLGLGLILFYSSPF